MPQLRTFWRAKSCATDVMPWGDSLLLQIQRDRRFGRRCLLVCSRKLCRVVRCCCLGFFQRMWSTALARLMNSRRLADVPFMFRSMTHSYVHQSVGGGSRRAAGVTKWLSSMIYHLSRRHSTKFIFRWLSLSSPDTDLLAAFLRGPHRQHTVGLYKHR